MSLYQFEWDDKLGQFKKEPKHDFTSHDTDAYRYLATIYNYLTSKKEPDNTLISFEDEMDELIFKNDYVELDFEDVDNPY